MDDKKEGSTTSEIRRTIEVLSDAAAAAASTISMKKRKRKAVGVDVASSQRKLDADELTPAAADDHITSATATATAIAPATFIASDGDGNDFDDGYVYVPTKTFLHVSKLLLLQILDKIGPTMAVLSQDVHQNIERLEKTFESNPSLYENLVEILKKERTEGSTRATMSCTRAVVWLTRSMDFAVGLLQKLVNDPKKPMDQSVEDSYESALKQYHGWISLTAYKVALRLVPDRNTLINLLMAEDGDYEILTRDIKILISLLLPLLDRIHSVLITFHSDRLKSA